jgi:hypothetical protein
MSVAAVPDGRLSTLPARPLPFRGASKRVGRQLHFEARSDFCKGSMVFR